MEVQMPPGALGATCTIVAWSFCCLAITLLLLWLVWIHGERVSYVALLAGTMAVSCLASIVQQIHTVVRWNDIKTDQWQNVIDNVGNPELNITGASTGLDLVVFYIQYYTYNVESLLVLFWSLELAFSVFQLRSTIGSQYHLAIIGKATAILLPAIQQILLRTTAVKHTTTGYMFLSSFLMLASFAMGCLVLLAILVKYVRARISLVSWNFQYGQRSTGTGTNSTSALRSGTNRGVPRRPRMKAIYDRWLLVRFTLAFFALGVFQLVVIKFQIRAASTNSPNNIPPVPDLSAERAVSDFLLFLPGVCAGPLTFIVFGTTRTFREYMLRVFLPKSWHAKLKVRRERRKKPSTVGTPESGIPRYPRPGNQSIDVEARNGNINGHGSYGGAVRMQDFARDHSSEEWTRNAGRKEDDDELPIMKPLPDIPRGAALRSNPP